MFEEYDVREPEDEMEDEELEEIEELLEEDEDWLQMARDAYRASTDYMNSSLRKQFEKNLALFRSKHPSGSKYHSKAYQHRSKIFRPKTRSAITRNEAQAATAFFATQDIVHVQPENPNDEAQRIQADLNGQLLNYRLENTIPWFQTCMGAFQDSMVIGACVSKQYWEYQEETTDDVEIDEDAGLLNDVKPVGKVVVDHPVVDLIPIENVRFDPAADWRNVVKSSPYFIHMIPMYAGEVKEKMKKIDPKTGQPKWYYADDDILASAYTNTDDDSTRQARLGNQRQDPLQQDNRVDDFRIVWIHENFIRKDGVDWVFYTIGDSHLLTDPVPIEDVYFTGERPFVIGHTTLETHKAVPSGGPELWEGIQTEINDVANQRLDNVRLVLNNRYFVNRSANIDTRSLTTSVPGGVVVMDDVNADIRPDRPGDVTASAYQEQDRLNIDFDEIAGAFSPGSVQSNRQLNETVGGMEMLSADSNSLTDYRLRIFSETWVQPVLKQLILLEQAYETDPIVLQIAGEKANAFQRLQVDAIEDWMIEAPVIPRVNVGVGASTPSQKIEKLNMGFSTLMNMMAVPGINLDEIKKEIFGALGYKDGTRFFNEEEAQDPEKQQMQQRIQELEAELQGRQVEAQAKVQVATINSQALLQKEQMRNQTTQQIEMFKARIKETDQQLEAAKLKANNRNEVAKLMQQREALIYNMRMKQAEQARNNMIQPDSEYGLMPGVEEQPGRG